VVVDEARRLNGQDVPIVITSILQTSAGRMVFGRLLDEHSSNHIEQSQREYIEAKPTSSNRS